VAAFSTPASTPASTANADLPTIAYPGSREGLASDATSQQVLKSVTGADPTLGNFTAQKVSFLFTSDTTAQVDAYYKKTFVDAGYQINNQQAGNGSALYVFQKNGTKVLVNFGALGDVKQLPAELQATAKVGDNLILIVSGTSILAPTVAPTAVNIPGTPVASPAAGQKKIATITLESGGVITMELYPDVAPVTVENFEKLANRGFYDGLTFHRIVPGFVVQGGDPNGDGSGGPGTGGDKGKVQPYTIPGEFTTIMKHDYGIVAMARTQDPNSAGSQFYIVTGHAGDPSLANLDGKYAIFGKVTSDMNIVLQIKQGDKMKTVHVENKQ
jgi:peptidyl-prolyl cis-trans isomerase B (cyclophilin B)